MSTPSNKTSQGGEGAVIALRPRLTGARVGPRQRRARDFLSELTATAGAMKRVRGLPAQTVFFLIHELGLADAGELLRMASPEQVQACLDIDCWQRDRLELQRMALWLEALSEQGPAVLGAAVAGMDHELLVTFLSRRVRVYDLSQDEPPEEPEGHFFATPDRFYLLDILPDGGSATSDADGDDQVGGDAGSGALLQGVLENLYRHDPELGRRVMMGARWDAGAETEENAYRFRTARMADLGFVDYYQALAIFKYADPRTITVGPPRTVATEDGPLFLPPELAEVLADPQRGGLFTVALGQLGAAEREAATRELLFLLNQVLSAERIDPLRASESRAELAAVLATLSLAIESLRGREGGASASDLSTVTAVAARSAEAGDAAAMAVLRGVEVGRLFRLGHSLTLQVARLANMLSQQGLLSLAPRSNPTSLLGEVPGQVVRALQTPRRPRFACALDQPVGEGSRPFRTLRDVAQVVAVLEEVGAVASLMTRGLGLRIETAAETLASCAPGPEAARYEDILGTMAGNLLLQRPPLFVPLHRGDLPALRRAALGLVPGATEISPTAQAAVLGLLRERVRERTGNPEATRALWTRTAERWVQRTLSALGRALAELPADLPEQQGAEPTAHPEAHLDLLPTLPGLVLR